ncbi:MAG: hypothetical protein ACREBE_10025, partial [bacterium]
MIGCFALWMMGVATGGCGTEPAGDDGAAASAGEAAQATAGAHRRPRPPRVGDLVAAMTLDEKIGLLIGNPIAGPPDPLGLAGAGYVPGVARLGIPPLRFSDGPAGIRTPLPT